MLQRGSRRFLSSRIQGFCRLPAALGNVSRRGYHFPRITEPFHPIPGRFPKTCTAEEAVTAIQSNHSVFVHGGSATPTHLIKALSKYGLGDGKLRNVTLIHIHTVGELPVGPEYAGVFWDKSLFIGSNVRKAIAAGRASYVPVFLSEIGRMFDEETIPLDVALIQVSPPDKHGFVTLGTNVDIARAAVRKSEILIAQVNKHMPRVHGDGQIHISHLDFIVEHDNYLPGWDDPAEQPSPEQKRIGEKVAELVEDGSTLQMGIGAIPNAVLEMLVDHRDLGVHTEMFMDGLVDLVEQGIVTNSRKVKHTGKVISTFCMGSKRSYQFLDDNAHINLLDAGYVNDVSVIRQNPRVVAINSAIEADVTGQICADSIGTRMFSGVGGQMDFMRGASESVGGKPIIAFQSVTPKGESKIVSMIKPGGGIVTTRANVHHVVTEYGHVNLYGMDLVERARSLIDIAHPKHREQLERESRERFGDVFPLKMHFGPRGEKVFTKSPMNEKHSDRTGATARKPTDAPSKKKKV